MKLPYMDRRIIMVDDSTDPPMMVANCLECGKMTNVLDSAGIRCPDCYKKWSLHFAKTWVLPF
ncbi:MAG: hypothetical protein HY645_14935 [Acidobacteria bacterium]|nr:hypothetical protein [Acidobacteriota bacterium]